MQILKSNTLKSIEKSDVQNGKLIIPANVEKIDCDFKDFISRYKVREIEFEKGSKLQLICANQFDNCHNIKRVDFSNCQCLESIDAEAFTNCREILSVSFNNCEKLVNIGKSAFTNCEKLREIDFSKCNNLEKIEDMAFLDCLQLSEVDFSNLKKLQKLGEQSFSHCENLTYLKLPKTLESIGQYFVGNCYKLEKLDFSNTNLKYIPDFAFYNCEKLKEIDCSNCVNLMGFHTYAFGRTRLEMLNFVGCENLKKIEEEYIVATDILKIDSHIIGDSKYIFKDIFLGVTDIQVYNNDKLKFSFDNCMSELSKLRVLGLGLHTYAKAKGYDFSSAILNVFSQKEELSVLMQNYVRTHKLIDALKVTNKEENTINALILLRRLGYFNVFQNMSKSEIQSYKMLLAKNLIQTKIKKDIKSSENKKFIEQLINEKTNRIARAMPLTNLVEQFVKDKISLLTLENQEKLLYEFSKMKYQYLPNLDFAKFLVGNFDKIIKTKIQNLNINEKINVEFIENIDGKIRLFEIANDFANILYASNKKVLTRKDKQKLDIDDCEYKNLYQNVNSGNEELADLCGSAHLTQLDFNELQDLFEIAKTKKKNQILYVCPDEKNKDITYEFIEKDNPIGLVLGNITNCCQKLGDFGESCVRVGATDENSAFITIKNKNKIIAQSWVWYDEKNKLIAFDNIEVPLVNQNYVDLHAKAINECLLRMFQNFYDTMNHSGHKVENIIVGSFATDMDFLDKVYNAETDYKKMYKCPIQYNNKFCYSDISKEGQYIIYKDGKLRAKASKLQNYEFSL